MLVVITIAKNLRSEPNADYFWRKEVCIFHKLRNQACQSSRYLHGNTLRNYWYPYARKITHLSLTTHVQVPQFTHSTHRSRRSAAKATIITHFVARYYRRLLPRHSQ